MCVVHPCFSAFHFIRQYSISHHHLIILMMMRSSSTVILENDWLVPSAVDPWQKNHHLHLQFHPIPGQWENDREKENESCREEGEEEEGEFPHFNLKFDGDYDYICLRKEWSALSSSSTNIQFYDTESWNIIMACQTFAHSYIVLAYQCNVCIQLSIFHFTFAMIA